MKLVIGIFFVIVATLVCSVASTLVAMSFTGGEYREAIKALFALILFAGFRAARKAYIKHRTTMAASNA